MTATADAEAAANELTPLADYLGSVLRRLRALPPLDLDLTQAYGNVLAEDVVAPHSFPAFDQAAVDGYAARWEDLGAEFRKWLGEFVNNGDETVTSAILDGMRKASGGAGT